MTRLQDPKTARRLGDGDPTEHHTKPSVNGLEAGWPRVIPHGVLSGPRRNPRWRPSRNLHTMSTDSSRQRIASPSEMLATERSPALLCGLRLLARTRWPIAE